MRFLLLLAIAAATALSVLAQPAPTSETRLYTLNCGRLDFQDMGAFSDTGGHAGESGTMAVPVT